MLNFIKNQDTVRKDNETVLEITKPLSLIEQSIVDVMLRGISYQYDVDDKLAPILIVHKDRTDINEIVNDINAVLDIKNTRFDKSEKHQQDMVKTIMIESIRLPIDDLLEVLHGAALYLSRKHNRKIELSSKGYNTLHLKINFTVKLTIWYFLYDSFKVIIQDANPDVAVGFDVCDEYRNTILEMID